jgi:uncharacterized membrane protein YkvA (DUF1232 family)
MTNSAANDIAKGLAPSHEPGILRTTEEKLSKAKTRGIKELFSNIRLLVQMLRTPGFSIEWQSRALMLAALVYFVVPADLTPDVLPIIGYVDDLIVLRWVLAKVQYEIQRFRTYAQQFPEQNAP